MSTPAQGNDDINLRFTVTDEASGAIDNVTRKLDQESRAANNNSRAAADNANSMRDMANGAVNVGQRIAGAANQVQALTSRLGTGGQAAGLLASVVSNTTAFAQMGSALGPAGTIAGGIVGLTQSIFGLVEAHEAATRAATEHRQELERLSTHTIQGDSNAGSRGSLNSLANAGADTATLNEEITQYRQQIADLQEQAQTRQGRGLQTAQSLAQIATGYQNELLALRQQVEMREEIIRQREEEAQQIQEQNEMERRAYEDANFGVTTILHTQGLRLRTQREITEATVAEAEATREAQEFSDRMDGNIRLVEERRTQMREQRERADHRYQEQQAAMIRVEEAYLTAVRQELDYRERINHELDLTNQKIRQQADEEQAAADLVLQKQQDTNRINEEHERRRTDALNERYFGSSDQRAHEAAEREKEMENVERWGGAAITVFQGVADASTAAIDAVVNQGLSGEEAFKMIMASFLKIVSQQATIQAGMEYAFAIKDFASGNYPGGAGHLAAGVAFTAVAVATGVAAGALSKPSPPADTGPTKAPEDQGRQERSNTMVINFNSPVVTAQTEAGLGIQLRNTIGAADSRFGDI